MTVPTMTVAARMASLVSRRSLAAISAYRLARTSASAARRWRRWLRMIIRDVWQWVLVPDFHRTTASKKSDEGRPEDQ